jgi:CRISPR-associated endonuclease Cas1
LKLAPSDFKWGTLSFSLTNTDEKTRSRAHFLSVIDAVLREPNKTFTSSTAIFRVLDRDIEKARILPGEVLKVQVILPNAQQHESALWRETFLRHLASGRQHYQVLGGQIDERYFGLSEQIEQFSLNLTSSVTLKFFTPFPFTPTILRAEVPKENQTVVPWHLDATELVKRFAHRAKKLFGQTYSDTELGEIASGLRVFPLYWDYRKISHASASTPGTTRWIKGCVGPLVIEGNLKPFLPLLLLCAAVNAGSELAWSQGYFEMDQSCHGPLSQLKDCSQAFAKRLDEMCRLDAAAAMSIASQYGQPFDVDRIAREVTQALASEKYECLPTRSFSVAKKSGGTRDIEMLDPVDAATHQILLSYLAPIAERTLEPQAMAYRPHVSREHAKQAIEDALSSGYTHALVTDIDDFFPSVDHEKLRSTLEKLLPFSEHLFITSLMTCVTIPIAQHGIPAARTKGLCQGSPLSPTLANIYLDHLDEALQRLDLRFIRYADDFLLLAKSNLEIEQAKKLLESKLAELGLNLNTKKTWKGIADEGFVYLGWRFGGLSIEVKNAPEVHKRAVYVTEMGTFLGVSGEALQIERKGQPARSLPLRRVSSVNVVTRATLSTPLLTKCAELGIPVSIAMDSAYDAAVWLPDRRSFYDVAYLQRSRYEAMTITTRIEIAKQIVATKVRNGIGLISVRYLPGHAEWERTQEILLQTLDCALTLESVRGVEGNAARQFFLRWSLPWNDTVFKYESRKRNQPDRINSMLNLGYSMLFARINLAVRALGLNPYLGYLHEDDERFETLVVDIQEVFRVHVDRLIARIIGLKIIRPEHFQDGERGQRFTSEGFRLFIHQFEEMLHSRPAQGKGFNTPINLSLADAIQAQVIAVKTFMTSGADLHWYSFRETK